MLRATYFGFSSKFIKPFFISVLFLFFLGGNTKGEIESYNSVKNEIEKSFNEIDNYLNGVTAKIKQIKNKQDLINYIASNSSDILQINFFKIDSISNTQIDSRGFFDDDLFVYYYHSNFIELNDTKLNIILNYKIKKHYKLNNKYFNDNYLLNLFEKKYNIKFNLTDNNVDSLSEKEFLIKRENNSLLLNLSELTVNENGINIYLLLGVLLIILLLILRNLVIKNLNFYKGLWRVLFDFCFIALLRVILYHFNFMKIIVPENLMEPGIYSSKFGWGIVSSPLELFITAVLAIIFLINFSYSVEELKLNNLTKVKRTSWLIICIITFFALYRSFGASIKSTVFDTTLVYFKSDTLFPGIEELFLIMTILLLSFFFVGMLYRILFLIYDLLPEKYNKKIFAVLILVEIIGLLFDSFQKNPQMTDLIRSLLIIFITGAIFIKIRYGLRKSYIAIYLMLTASIISISLMMYYNNELEKDALELMALDATRTSEGWLQFALQDVLYSINDDSYLIERFKKEGTNFNSVAFVIWSKTVLQKESLVSQISILDTNKELLGLYGYDFDYDLEYDKLLEGSNVDINFVDEFNELKKVELKHAIMPVIIDDINYGSILISILKDNIPFNRSSEPEVIRADKIHLESTLSTRDISFYLFDGNELIYSNSKLSVSEKDRENILENATGKTQWIELNINGEKNLFYTLRNGERLFVFGINDKDISTTLFEFFKLFIIHSVIILFVLFLYMAFYFTKDKSIRVTYRSKILGGLIIVSIIPMIILALYFRGMSEDKNSESIKYKLKKRATLVADYLTAYLTDENNLDVLNRATVDLNINYTLYKEGLLYYSSTGKYYNINLLNDYIDPVVLEKLSNSGYDEEIKTYKLDKYRYNAYFKRFVLNNEEYILKISDLFNKFSLPISNAELDVFLFGTYSFAFFLVIILSVVLANQITNPINILLKATKELGKGNYDVYIPEKYKGEIGELIKIFNEMTLQVRKSRKLLAKMEREQAWEEMARQVAHEIKNPLTPLKLSVQQLEISYKENSDKFAMLFPKIIKTVIKQIDLLHSIADEFSSFAKMPKIKPKKIKLKDVLKRVETLYEGDIIKVRIACADDVSVLSDEEQLYRVLINLVKNSKQAGATVANIEVTDKDEYIEILVRDNGNGIPGNIRDKIFEPNFTTKIEGMGLGLSLAKKFLNNTGGNIEVNSSSSKGAEFKIVLRKDGSKVN